MKRLLFIVFVLILFLSCISNRRSSENWLNKPNNNEFYYSPKLDIPIIFIKQDKLNEAIILLNDTIYKILTDEEYEYFTGKPKNEAKNAYLIRSVNYSFNESGYRICKNDNNNLLISHNVLGNSRNIQKWPIIILYNDMDIINEIYTDCNIAR